MIRALVDFALNNKFVVLAIAVLLLGWGAISFHNLPVEAYPDIADNYVTVITQWAGVPPKKWNSRSRFRSKFKWPECRT
jgi:heavy metal efflux system protein